MTHLWRILPDALRMTEPEALPRDAYWRTVWAVLLLAVSLGLQATVVAMVAWGPLAPPIPPETLTQVGRDNMRPEWDLPAFYAGCFVTMLLCLAALRAWNARLRRPDAARAARRGAALHAALGLASAWVFVAIAGAAGAHVDDAFRLPAAQIVRLGLPALVALAVLGAYHLRAWRS